MWRGPSCGLAMLVGTLCCCGCPAAQFKIVVPRGLEPRTLRLLAVRSNQLSYETSGVMLLSKLCCLITEVQSH